MYDQTTEEAVCFDPNSNTMPEQQQQQPPLPADSSSVVTAFPTVPAQQEVIQNGFCDHISPPPFSPIDHQQIPINNPNNPQELLDQTIELNHLQNPHLGSFNLNPLASCTDHNSNNNNIAEMGFGHYEEIQVPTSTTDLLTLLHLPRCSSFPPTPSFNPALIPDNPTGSGGSSTISYDPCSMPAYDPLFGLNLPPQPSPLLRDLMFQSLPHGFGGIQTRGNENIGNVNGNTSYSLFGGSLDEGEGNIINGITGIYQDGGDHQHHHHMHTNGIFEFSTGEGKEGKCPKNFVTERQRRANFNNKYQQLRDLVPSPSKGDRASIVGDAIKHINELKMTVGELKILVEKKRMSKERVKRLRTEDKDNNSTPTGQGLGGSGMIKPDPDEAFNGSTQLRSSWLQRKCKDTEVDVRIVDDDVTIKLVQRKKINCLMSVSQTLDDLQLDLRHVAGGHVGDYYSYLFNTKISEGSSVYASAIANKLIEVVERQYATASIALPTSSF